MFCWEAIIDFLVYMKKFFFSLELFSFKKSFHFNSSFNNTQNEFAFTDFLSVTGAHNIEAIVEKKQTCNNIHNQRKEMLCYFNELYHNLKTFFCFIDFFFHHHHPLFIYNIFWTWVFRTKVILIAHTKDLFFPFIPYFSF